MEFLKTEWLTIVVIYFYSHFWDLAGVWLTWDGLSWSTLLHTAGNEMED